MSALRVLIVGEGRSDIGDLDALALPQPVGKRAKAVVQGFVPPLVRRVLGKVDIEAQKVTSLGRYEKKAKLDGHADKAAKALALAFAGSFDVLVFVKDVDRQGGVKKSAKERNAKLKAMHFQIDAGFAAVTGAEAVARVKGTPCRMIEAWALGDADAIAKVANVRAKREPCPSAPEELWGDESDTASSHPKCVLPRVLGKEAAAETFEEIAHEVDLDRLVESCPESFEPFLRELRAVLTLRLAAPK